MSDEIDRLVAEKVMGWKLANRQANGWGSGPPVWLTGADQDDEMSSPTWQEFSPSSCLDEALIAARAWVKDEYRSVTITIGNGGVSWAYCKFLERGYRPFQDSHWEASADTIPMAICLAALKAVGAEVAHD